MFNIDFIISFIILFLLYFFLVFVIKTVKTLLEVKNEKKFLMIAGATFIFLSGCATKEYVKEQTNPIYQKLERIEKQLENMNKEISSIKTDIKAVDSKVDSVQWTAKEALKKNQKKL